MTKTGIHFIQVTLVELNFKLNKKFKLPKGGIPVEINFDQKNTYSRDKKTLTTHFSATLFHKTKAPPFKLKVSVEGTFVGDDAKELRNFSKIHAPAHIMPFVREIIGNTTMKANIPPLLLPPFNIKALFSKK